MSLTLIERSDSVVAAAEAAATRVKSLRMVAMALAAMGAAFRCCSRRR